MEEKSSLVNHNTNILISHFKKTYLNSFVIKFKEIYLNFFIFSIEFEEFLFPSEKLKKFEIFQKNFQIYTIKYIKLFSENINIFHNSEDWILNLVPKIKKFFNKETIEFTEKNLTCLKEENRFIGYPFKFKIKYNLKELKNILIQENQNFQSIFKEIETENFFEICFLLQSIIYFYEFLQKMIY